MQVFIVFDVQVNLKGLAGKDSSITRYAKFYLDSMSLPSVLLLDVSRVRNLSSTGLSLRSR